MSTADVVRVNGRDITDFGLVALDLADWWSAPRRTRNAATVAGRIGSTPSDEAIYEPRRLPLELMLETTVQGRSAALDEIGRQMTGLLEVSVGDDFGKVCDFVLEGDEVTGRTASSVMYHGNLRSRLNLVSYNPLKYDRLASTLVVPSTGRTDVPMGSAPMHGTLMVLGPATTPTVTLRTQGGEQLDSMTFASLASDEYYEVDLEAQTVTKVDSGVRSDALDQVTAGWFFAFDDADSPTIEINSGSAVLHYRRRWER